MKIVHCFCLCMVVCSMYPDIPFNPLLNNECKQIKYDSYDKKNITIVSDDKKNDILRGSITMFQDNSLVLKNAPNYALRLPNGNVEFWDKKQNISIALDGYWEEWNEKDKKEGRLFRYFMFYDIIGMMEGPFRELSPKCKKKYIKSHALKNNAFGKESDFTLKKVGELEETFNKALPDLKNKKKTPGTIERLDFYEIWKDEGMMKAFEKTDIRALQANNPGAWFQLASTKNCLEGDVTNHGLEAMNQSPVQGENAVATTMGAGIVRTYLIQEDERYLFGSFKADTKNDEKDIESISIGIHENVVVTSGYYAPFVRTNSDDLEDIGGFKTTLMHKGTDKEFVRKNYIDFTEKPIINYADDQKNIADSNKKIDKKRIEFLFKNKFVKKDRNPVYVFNKELDITNPIKITQVFTATYKYSDGECTSQQQDNGKILLKAMYKGTILAAALAKAEGKCEKLFLTLVGTGAFGHESKWVMDALNDPAILQAIYYTGLKVIIVLFHDIRGGRSINDKKFDYYYNKNDEISQMGALDGIRLYTNTLNNNIQKGNVATELSTSTFIDEWHQKKSIDTFARALKSIAKKA